MTAVSILQPGNFEHYVTVAHGMTFALDTPRDTWLTTVQRLCAMYEGSVMTRERTLMLLADALNFGEQTYGESFAQAIDGMRQSLGLSPATVKNAQWAYGKIPAILRRDGLTISHYKEIAALELGEQESFIARAITEGMSVATLKIEVAAIHPKIKRGKTRKAANDDAESALQKLVDVTNWIQGVNINLIGDAWKPHLEITAKIYRHRWGKKGK